MVAIGVHMGAFTFYGRTVYFTFKYLKKLACLCETFFDTSTSFHKPVKKMNIFV
jgi:hypothetical protein